MLNARHGGARRGRRRVGRCLLRSDRCPLIAALFRRCLVVGCPLNAVVLLSVVRGRSLPFPLCTLLPWLAGSSRRSLGEDGNQCRRLPSSPTDEVAVSADGRTGRGEVDLPPLSGFSSQEVLNNLLARGEENKVPRRSRAD
jgi:hypothetical protein